MDYGTTVDVTLEGVADLIFDRLSRKKSSDRGLEDRLYLDDDRGLIIPAENLYTFFYAESYASAVNIFWTDNRTRRRILQQARSSIFIEPEAIPILRKGKQIKLSKWTKRQATGYLEDKKAAIYEYWRPGRVKGGVIAEMDKTRPVLRMPWEVSFVLRVFEVEGHDLTLDLVESWLRRGGMMLALGTYRPRYGRFEVTKFEPRKA